MAIRKTRRKVAARKRAGKARVQGSAAARLTRELAFARAQQKATAEILRIISQSPAEAQPVFEAIVKSCDELFPDSGVNLRLLQGDQLVVRASRRYDSGTIPVASDSAVGSCVLEAKPIHLPDLDAAVRRFPRVRQLGLKFGFRSGIYTPLLRSGVAIGTITVLRRKAGAFSDRELALLRVFADQAVIAIENVRLFNETKDALERQTATAGVLGVIAASPADIQPVFDAIVKSAVRLCGARFGRIYRYDGAQIEMVAGHGLSAAGKHRVESVFPRPAADDTIVGRVVLSRKPYFLTDIRTNDQVPTLSRQMIEALDTRSQVTVPMLRSGDPIGALTIGWDEPGTFNPQQVKLLQVFADQAVIAIENARLFNTTREALEQQTAISEILRVMAGSPADVTPVLNAVNERAMRICDSLDSRVFLVEGGDTLRYVAGWGDVGTLPVGFARPLTRGLVMGRAVIDKAPVHLEDLAAVSETEFPLARQSQRLHGHRTTLAVPLLRDDKALGVILLRRSEVRPFTERQIELLRTFADQAAIAIENVRLFNETREALDRQTATAEILNVISRSPTDVQPVLDAIVASAIRMVGATTAHVTRVVGEHMHLGAMSKTDAEGAAAMHRLYPFVIAGSPAEKVVRERSVWIVENVETDTGVPEQVKLTCKARGVRSFIVVPMVSSGATLGTIVVNRARTGPFSPHETGLLRTFADQAVIAIENVRLFNETKQALERQTATGEILKVIASSPADVQPVFDAIVSSVSRLFGRKAALRTVDPDGLRRRARSYDPEEGEFHGAEVEPLDRRSIVGQAVLAGRTLQWADTLVDGAATYGMERAKALSFRSIASAPLMLKGRAIGVISVSSPQPGTLTAKQMELLATFADQAVIAIENVRLFNETKEALERQTATAEILRVIASSPSDVQPVFDAIVEAAKRLIGAFSAVVTRVVGDELHLVSHTVTTPDGAEALGRYFPIPIHGSPMGRALLSRQPGFIDDFEADTDDARDGRELARSRGFRSVVFVPLVREGVAIGSLNVTRREAGRVSEHHVQLLKTFADQAVIAIENVRLFNETKESLERQTATAEILKVISSSPTDVQPVFDAITQAGLKLFPGSVVLVGIPRGDQVHAVAAAHDSAVSNRIMSRFPVPLRHTHLHGAAILDSKLIDLPDARAETDGPYAQGVQNFLASGLNAMTIVPLMHGNRAIGAISVSRAKPGPLSEKQVALLRTFADQAVIAIENVRLFKELKQRVEQMTALREVGQALGSTLELDKVLQTVVTRAVQLTGLDGGAIYEYDPQEATYALKAAEGFPEEFVEAVRRTPIRKGDGATGRTAETLEPVQVPDILDDGYSGSRKDLLARAGYRGILAVPLLREDALVGALMVMRKTPGAFPAEVVELLRTFAAQSALAIRNAHLFREIAEKGRQLEEASRHKSNFLASMSHELRTPLNAILGFNEMILGDVYGEVPADMREPLEDIQTSGKHLLRLINNVLDLAKIEAGRMELALADYSVHDTVASVHATLRPLAAEKGLEFIATLPDDLPLAHGDAGRITQCLMNLAGNSLKFTKSGKVEISVALRESLLEYRVTDTGIGIAPDKIGSLFTEFKQTDATIASEYGGTGLGLSISKQFIEMHGGRIWVESEVGRGSAFIFQIPLRVSA